MKSWLIGLLTGGGILTAVWAWVFRRRRALDDAHEAGRKRGRAELASELAERAALAARERRTEIAEGVVAIEAVRREKAAEAHEQHDEYQVLIEDDPYRAVAILGAAIEGRKEDGE